jgi:hypothetical protein
VPEICEDEIVRIHKYEPGVQIWIRECGVKGKLGEAKPRTLIDARWVGVTGVVMRKNFDTDETRKVAYKKGAQVAYVKKRILDGKWTEEEFKAKIVKVTPGSNFKDMRYGIKYIDVEKKDFTKKMNVPVSKLRPCFLNSWWIQMDITPAHAQLLLTPAECELARHNLDLMHSFTKRSIEPNLCICTPSSPSLSLPVSAWLYIPEHLLRLNRRKEAKKTTTIVKKVQNVETRFWGRLIRVEVAYLGCLCVLVFCAWYFGF